MIADIIFSVVGDTVKFSTLKTLSGPFELAECLDHQRLHRKSEIKFPNRHSNLSV